MPGPYRFTREGGGEPLPQAVAAVFCGRQVGSGICWKPHFCAGLLAG